MLFTLNHKPRPKWIAKKKTGHHSPNDKQLKCWSFFSTSLLRSSNGSNDRTNSRKSEILLNIQNEYFIRMLWFGADGDGTSVCVYIARICFFWCLAVVALVFGCFWLNSVQIEWTITLCTHLIESFSVYINLYIADDGSSNTTNPNEVPHVKYFGFSHLPHRILALHTMSNVSLVYQHQHQHQQRRIFGNNEIHFRSRLWNVYKCKMCKISSQISMSVYAWMYVFFIIFAKAFCLIPYSFSFNLPAFHVHNFMNCYSVSCCVLQFCCSRCRFLFISNSLLNRHHMIDWIK